MTFEIVKAIHIIFVVSYFAGLFYMVRLFIYHTEAQQLPQPKKDILTQQYRFMESRLWNIITVPAFFLMLLSGGFMLFSRWSYFSTQSWMYVKLFFVVLLILYHIWTWQTLKQMQQNIFKMSSVRLRMMNEVATLILFVVVFAVILKTYFIDYWYWVLITFVGVGIIIMLMVKTLNRKK